ncbi:MAG: hypothetical protein NVS3B28_27680 [Candidatus Velthaea sp.]
MPSKRGLPRSRGAADEIRATSDEASAKDFIKPWDAGCNAIQLGFIGPTIGGDDDDDSLPTTLQKQASRALIPT